MADIDEPRILAMANNADAERVVAVCKQCGSAVAGEEWPDGTIRPIGQDGCDCGSDEFAVVEGCGGPGFSLRAESD